MEFEFEYEGVQNGMYAFREKATGQAHFVHVLHPGVEPELLDGDEVALVRPGSTDYEIFSIRQQRNIRSERRGF